MLKFLVACLAITPLLAFSQDNQSITIEERNVPPLFFKKSQPFAHTYSIIARDEKTGQMGAAVQSHWFAAGKSVPFAEAGVGVSASQSMVDLSYGPTALYYMSKGATAEEALDRVIKDDDNREVRQFALLDNHGGVAGFTGDRCITEACDYQGDGFSVQANLMTKPGVCVAMAKAFEGSLGKPLADRMMLALEAAEEVSGDLRGKQSAALVIVNGEHTGVPWVDKPVEIHVDDHTQPIQELRRLYTIKVAYDEMNQGDLAMETDNLPVAQGHYDNALFLFPENLEMQYWYAITLAGQGDIDEAARRLQSIYKQDSNWRILTQRLPASGFLTVSDEDLNRLLE